MWILSPKQKNINCTNMTNDAFKKTVDFLGQTVPSSGQQKGYMKEDIVHKTKQKQKQKQKQTNKQTKKNQKTKQKKKKNKRSNQ
jgi:hypothetical protein